MIIHEQIADMMADVALEVITSDQIRDLIPLRQKLRDKMLKRLKSSFPVPQEPDAHYLNFSRIGQRIEKLLAITPDPNRLIREMSDSEIARVRVRIRRFFRGKDIDEYLGLPYTDTGAFAGLWNTNARDAEYEGHWVRGFSITNRGNVVMLTQDDDEQEYWYILA